ncbi:MAG: prepilin peptidase [Patescibacteria group bacterium]
MVALIFFVLGLVVGSFLNVLIDRLPRGQTVIWGRSRCDFCHQTLRWFELIPVLSYFLQRGRCRHCHKLLPAQYPLIELVTAGLFTFFGLQFYHINMLTREYIHLFSVFLIISSLVVIFVIDFKHQIISDNMLVLGFVGILSAYLASPWPSLGRTLPYLISAASGASFFLLLWLVTRGRGLGLGDVKLVFLLGLILGYPGIIIGLYGAFLTGAIAGVILILARKKTLKSRIAFGPFLIVGALIAILWGKQLIGWWQGLI